MVEETRELATRKPEGTGTMFSRWGAFVYRFRRPIVLLTILLAIGSLTLASKASDELSSGGWLDPNSESAQVADRLASEFGAGKSSMIAVFQTLNGTDASSADVQQQIQSALADVVKDGHVTGLIGFAQTGDRRFISTNGDAAYSLIQLDVSDEESVELVDGIRSAIHPPAGLDVKLTGYGPITKDSAEASERDLQRAEQVSLPFAALILIAVFASLIAAGMPLLVAGLAIPSTLALIYVVALQVEMSIYVLNIATMLGLSLAIDYSLFIVSRFREELARGRTVGESVERAIGTSGKAVAFSGFAVAIGLSGLLFFEAAALRSIGIAGSLTVLSSAFYALTFLPALLGMLGPRVNALSFGGLIRRFRPAAELDRTRESRWAGVAQAVMRRPGAVLVPVLAFLFLLGTPFFRLQQGVPDASIFPAGLESRDAYHALVVEFPKGETTPITVLADVKGSPTDPANVRALADYAGRLQAIDGIDRVESPFSNLKNPETGAALTTDEIVALYSQPQLPPQLQALLASYIHGPTVRLDAISPLDPARPDGTAIVATVRDTSAGAGITTQVGGVAALSHDFLVSQAERMPWAIGVTLVASALILFLLLGSLAIPIKGVIMTLLSISASFGALVWIFQEGNLSNVLNFEPVGFTIAGNPIIMFSVIFGLSMDYEVLLLSRIQEAYRRTGDNRASVAEGLARTAGVITGAALIMVSVFSAFALAQIITIKSIGVGMAVAVLLDATIIRVLLVPATMRLLGRWNWWAPGVLGRLADRLGFSQVEDEDP